MKIKIKKHDNESSFKALGAFLVFVIVVGIFSLFRNYQDNIIEGGNLQSFMFLAIIGSGFLLVLLFLINKPLKKARKKK